jgi:hypothetical protein
MSVWFLWLTWSQCILSFFGGPIWLRLVVFMIFIKIIFLKLIYQNNQEHIKKKLIFNRNRCSYVMVITYSYKLMYFSPFQLNYGSTTLKIVVLIFDKDILVILIWIIGFPRFNSSESLAIINSIFINFNLSNFYKF